MEDEILNFFGKMVIYGGGSATIGYLVFSFLGKKWIDNHFSKQLEKYKHEQNKEIEETRYKINALFSRVIKIHDKEFEVLPDAWSSLCDAINRLTDFTSIYKELPDFENMNEPMFETYVDNLTMHEYEKDEIRKSENKLKYYENWIHYRKMNDARKAISDFHVYIQKNSIFLNQELKNEFRKIDDIMWSSYISMDVGHEAQDFKMKVEAFQKIKDQVNPIKNSIEDLLQERLHYNDAE